MYHLKGEVQFHIYYYYHYFGRLFLTMDPVHGEISRAMRNRGIEVFMLPNVSSAECLKC